MGCDYGINGLIWEEMDLGQKGWAQEVIKMKIKPKHVNKIHTRPKIKILRVMHDTIIDTNKSAQMSQLITNDI